VSDLAAQVTAALGRSVLPSVIARGGAVRVAGADTHGVVTLEVAGSPGAVFPLASRIEAAIRAAVPRVTAVRLVASGTGPSGSAAGPADSPAEADLAAAARQLLDAEVNPAIAAHRGRVTVTGADQGWIRIRLEGGCQGCSLAEVTIRQGIEPLLRTRLPAVTGLIDTTDHEAGTDPFFSPEKR
jgi:NFU1 iron-sulfur cluster scaffold homolog, mitochondrial